MRIVVGLLFLVGCTPPPAPRGTVKGKVTLDSQPITGATIMFENREIGVARTYSLDEDGSFEIKSYDGEGLPVGKYQVAIIPGSTMKSDEIPLAGKPIPKKPPPSTKIALKYHNVDTSELSADVKEGQNTPLEFKLVK